MNGELMLNDVKYEFKVNKRNNLEISWKDEDGINIKLAMSELELADLNEIFATDINPNAFTNNKVTLACDIAMQIFKQRYESENYTIEDAHLVDTYGDDFYSKVDKLALYHTIPDNEVKQLREVLQHFKIEVLEDAMRWRLRGLTTKQAIDVMLVRSLTSSSAKKHFNM